MKVLILTQIVDRTDRELGFFHEWISAFSREFEFVTVVGLKVGEYELPENVRVLSLGKERGRSRVRALVRFFRYITSYRREYDAVYVHMNQEYVLLGGLVWRLMGKRVTLWRNHYAGSMLTTLAVWWSHRVFCTSHYSFTARSRKTVLMPVGVPDRLFYPHDDVERVPASILSLGRIAPSKKLEQFIDALALMHARGVVFTATICGSPLPPYEAYHRSLKERVEAAGLRTLVQFVPGVAYSETPELYGAHEVFVNMSKSGMLDKTLFEAMLSETLILTCNKDLADEIRDLFIFREDDVEHLATQLTCLLMLSSDEKVRARSGLRVYAAREHSLSALAVRLREELAG